MSNGEEWEFNAGPSISRYNVYGWLIKQLPAEGGTDVSDDASSFACLWLMGCVWILLLAAACKPANPAPQKFGGTWTMRLGDRTFLVLALTENGDKVSGTIAGPSRFQLDASGTRFSQITSDEVKEVITSATIKDDRLRFTTANPKDPGDTSDYELVITGKDHASLKIWTPHLIRGPSQSSGWFN